MPLPPLCKNGHEGGRFSHFVSAFSQPRESVTLVPRGTVAHCINPLNWRTDATPAPAALNAGGCLRSFGSMGTPQRGFCGAVINPQRGTLNPQFAEGARAPRSNPFFGSGIYHAHEPFLYRANHRRNVVQRIEAYLQAGENH